ncbi:hypothetical protein [Actinomycetospora atypica]|uniref:Transcriptional regulator, AbiEi antitoxin, Type IV TA system n=1 Tax=Actinomycetospora atypica TaxID=1290095 RepID=A0ABV9YGN2_9PSEU
MDLRQPFRHTDLVRSGALTRHHLVDGRFHRLFPGVSVDRDVVVTMAVRAAGAVLLHPDAVVMGHAAAGLWDAEADPDDVTVDLAVGAGGRRTSPGLRLHRVDLPDEEVAPRRSGVRCTTPARTAFDLARWLPRGEAVVAIDALAARTGLPLDDVRAIVAAHPGQRDVLAVEPVLVQVDPRSRGAAQSRRRVRLLARGVPVPRVDQRLLDADGARVADLPLAWPEARTGLTAQPGTARRAREIGWQLLETGVTAPVDGVVTWLRRSLERWDPPPRAGSPTAPRLPPAPEGDGTCDGGLSRLVEA